MSAPAIALGPPLSSLQDLVGAVAKGAKDAFDLRLRALRDLTDVVIEETRTGFTAETPDKVLDEARALIPRLSVWYRHALPIAQELATRAGAHGQLSVRQGALETWKRLAERPEQDLPRLLSTVRRDLRASASLLEQMAQKDSALAESGEDPIAGLSEEQAKEAFVLLALVQGLIVAGQSGGIREHTLEAIGTALWRIARDSALQMLGERAVEDAFDNAVAQEAELEAEGALSADEFERELTSEELQ